MIKEIKYFHPSGAMLPNGSHYQKGGFLKECRENMNSFLSSYQSKGINIENEKTGGFIIFPEDFFQSQKSEKGIERDEEESFKDSLGNDEDKWGYIETPEDRVSRKVDEFVGAELEENPKRKIYTFGSSFKGKYVGDNGETFNEQCLCLEIDGLPSEDLLNLANVIADRFKIGAMLVRDFHHDKVYLVNSL